jgi:hypothetical protein
MTGVMPVDSVRVAKPAPRPPAWMVARGLDRCGHCKTGLHRSCKGAIRVPVSKKLPDGLLRCHCPDCVPQVRCLDCHNQFEDEVDPRWWACIDRDVCLGRIALRQRNDPVWQLIQSCKSRGAWLRREDRLRRALIRAETLSESVDAAAVRGEPRPTVGQCECCGQPTKGGRFLPGHDAKLKGRLKRLNAAGDKAAYKELVERGWA